MIFSVNQDLLMYCLDAVRSRAKPFLLGGGTGLAIGYLKHRVSFDLDFFARSEADLERCAEITGIWQAAGIYVEPFRTHQAADGRITGHRFRLIQGEQEIKGDFLNDGLPFRAPGKEKSGIHFLDIDDIYYRKLMIAVTGVMGERAGLLTAPRLAARDAIDLHALSTEHTSLSRRISAAGLTFDHLDAMNNWLRRIGVGEISHSIRETGYRLETLGSRVVEHIASEIKVAVADLVRETIE